MELTDRREFFKSLFRLPVMVKVAYDIASKPKPLPLVKPFDTMSAQAWNDLVERVNELSRR